MRPNQTETASILDLPSLRPGIYRSVCAAVAKASGDDFSHIRFSCAEEPRDPETNAELMNSLMDGTSGGSESWTIVINKFERLWPDYRDFLTSELEEIAAHYAFGYHRFELVLFAGSRSQTSFGPHVDPQNMRAYHFQIKGTKTFHFDTETEIRFGERLRASPDNFKERHHVQAGQIIYLPTIFPHYATYSGRSASIALAVWRRSRADYFEFLLRRGAEDDLCSSFKDYADSFRSKHPHITLETISILQQAHEDPPRPKSIEDWFAS